MLAVFHRNTPTYLLLSMSFVCDSYYLILANTQEGKDDKNTSHYDIHPFLIILTCLCACSRILLAIEETDGRF